METFLGAAVVLLIVIIIILSVKIYFMKKAAAQICRSFEEKLNTDTNTLIDISSCDRQMRRLAASINRQLAILRRQRHRYVHGDQELKETITNLSHDLRTPLTAVCGYLDLLDKEDLSPDGRRYAKIIRERTQTMRRLTQELFSYSALTAVRDTLSLEDVDLNQMLEESILAYYGALKARNILPVIHLPDTPLHRRLNKNALSRIFSNVLGNAIKYSSGDLNITMTPGGEIIFSNSAPSLDPIQVGRLFDRYYTVEAASKPDGGIGLAIARTMTEAMGGTILARYVSGRLYIHILFEEKQ